MASVRTTRQSPSGPRSTDRLVATLDYGTIPSMAVGSITLSGLYTYAGLNQVLTAAVAKPGDGVIVNANWPAGIAFGGASVGGSSTAPVITLRLSNPTGTGVAVGELQTIITAILNS